MQHIIACILECWRHCFCLEKMCDGFVVCQNNCWLCCFPGNVCKLTKCHVDCHKLFCIHGHLSCAEEKIFEPNATGAYLFRFDCIFWSGLFSIKKACSARLKLASLIKTSCFPGMGCLSANWQVSLTALLTESNISVNSDVILIGTSVLSNL